jgi:hypothetical protein
MKERCILCSLVSLVKRCVSLELQWYGLSNFIAQRFSALIGVDVHTSAGASSGSGLRGVFACMGISVCVLGVELRLFYSFPTDLHVSLTVYGLGSLTVGTPH